MRTDWIDSSVMSHILAALTEPNRLAIVVSLVTGMRIGDVLKLRPGDLRKERLIYTEEKTKKRRRVRIPLKLRRELMAQSGKVFVFEHRLDPMKPRTRQAVFKDIKRAATAFRIPLVVGCHTARKVYAVDEYRRDMNVRRVKNLLNHSSEAVTLVYILADEMTARKEEIRKRRTSKCGK